MNNKNTIICFLFIPMFIISGCYKNNADPDPDPPSGIIGNNLITLEDALSHPNRDFANLVNKVRGSVGTLGPASKVIWSRKNDYNLGLYVSANHVYGVSTWSSREESYINLLDVNNGIFLGSKIPLKDGAVSLGNHLIADFGLYHPEIPESATNTTISPANDFYIGILDNQRAIDDGFGTYPNTIQTEYPLEMYDPNGRTTNDQTWADIFDRDSILVIGYPQDRTNYPNGAVSIGIVLTDAEAEYAIEELRRLGDEEGQIPYDSDVEFIANAKAVSGMSGGGVFNSEGQLVGISIRATILNDKPLLRVVRITYVRDKLLSFYYNLSLLNQSILGPFISGEL